MKRRTQKKYICMAGNYYQHYAPKYVGEIKTIEEWCKTFFKENTYDDFKNRNFTDKDIAEYITNNIQQVLVAYKN